MATADEDARRRVEGVVEQRIREATERGDFADLPGAGRPLRGLDDTYDPAWWAKRWLRRQRLEAEAEDLRAERRRIRPRAGLSEEAAERLASIENRIAELEREIAESGGAPHR